MNVKIGRQNIKLFFGNDEAAQFHFWEFINRNQTFILDSHRPFFCSVIKNLVTKAYLGFLQEMQRETEHYNSFWEMENNEVAQLHFCEYVNRNQTFILDSHWPFFCSVIKNVQ
jgi:hypothetical protein